MDADKKKKGGAAATGRQTLLRAIPQVDEVLQWLSPETDAPMFLVKQTVRAELEILRQDILAGQKVGKYIGEKKFVLINNFFGSNFRFISFK